MKDYIENYFYGFLLSIIFVAFGGYRAIEIDENSIAYQNSMHEHVRVLNFEERLLNVKEWSLLLTEKVLSFVNDSEWKKKKELSDSYLAKANESYSFAIKKSIEIGIVALSLLVIVSILYYKREKRLGLVVPLLSIASVFLYLGIFNPMLEISAFSSDLEIPLSIDFDNVSSPIKKGLEWIDNVTGLAITTEISSEIPSKFETSIQFKGRMYYYYQSKSIYQLIQLLFKDKNFLVGIAILAFSIVIPILKLFLSLLISFSSKEFSNLKKVLSLIGKWSMADVFVASVFLAFLSFSNMSIGIETESNVSFGLYFFLGYVILSMFIGVLINSKTAEQKSNFN